MKYTRSRSNMNKKGKKRFSWMHVFVPAAIILIVLGVFWVALSGEEPQVASSDGPEVIGEDDGQVVEDVLIATDFEQIDLTDPEGRGYTGIARRGIENDLYTHVVVGDLPAIDTERYFYEGWLVQPGVLKFFSTGEMFAREDGKWGLVWEVSERDQEVDVTEYTRAVITLEPRDGDPAPAADHVLEGDFEIEVEFSGLLPF